MKFNEDRNRTRMIFEPEKTTKVTEILPTKNSSDDSARQEKDHLSKMLNSDYSATRGDSQLINMKEYSGSRMHCYHSDMPTERQISASSNSEISNKSGSDPDIDIEKCVDGVLKLINVLMKYSINGSKASECNLKATHSSQSLEHQLSKIIQAISEKLIDSDLLEFSKNCY